MPEREVYNPETGQYELYDPYRHDPNAREPLAVTPPMATATTPPAETTPPATDPPPTTNRGTNRRPREVVEAEGRAHDAAQNPPLIGGYYNEETGEWVNGSPSSGGPGGDNPYLVGGGGGADWDFDPGSFRFSPFNAPNYQGYQEFQANPFVAPDPAATADDPWLQFALKQGTNQLNNSAAYQGMLRSGMNNQRILEHGINFTRQFGNDVWNRALQGWQANEDSRFRAWGGNRANSLDTFDRQYRSQYDQFNAQRDAEKMDFNARLQQWRDRLNATTQIATAGL